MAGFDPDAYLTESDPGDFNPDAYLADGVEPGSPLAQALASQTGDVVTVDTPTGPAQFDRQGNRVASADEVSQQMDAGGGGLKQRALEGALSFLSGGGPLVDEAQGVKSALKRSMATLEGRDAVDPVTAYRKGRDDARKTVSRATADASPTVSVMGADIPVLPALGMVAASGPVAQTVLPRLAAAGYGAALQGAGASEADLTRGDVGGVARDAATSGAVGIGGGVAGEVLGALPRALANSKWLQDKAANALVKGEALAAKPVDKAAEAFDESVASAAGKWRSETQKASRLLENTQRGAGGLSPAGSGPAAVDPALQGRAALALSSPEARALAEGVLENTLDELPQQLGEVAKAKAVRDALQAAKPAMRSAYAAQRGQAVADYFAEPMKPMATFLRSQIPRQAFGLASGGALSGLGYLTDSDVLKYGGAALYGSVAGAPGFYRAAQNLARSPAFQLAAAKATQGAASSLANSGARAGNVAGLIGGRELTDEKRRQIDALLAVLRGDPPDAQAP